MKESQKKKKKYNLAGLRYIFYSQIVSMILSIAGTALEKYLIASIVVFILALVALVVSIMGVFKISKYNDHFRKCRKIIVALFVMVFLMIIGLIASINSDVEGMILVTAIIFPVILCIAAVILNLLFAYHLFYGCGEIGDDQGDRKFGARCRRGWVIYIVCMVIMVLSAVVGLILSGNMKEPTAAAGICVALLLICAILSLVKIMQIVFLTFKRYDGMEIAEPPDFLKIEGLDQAGQTPGQTVLDDPLLKDEMPCENPSDNQKE